LKTNGRLKNTGIPGQQKMAGKKRKMVPNGQKILRAESKWPVQKHGITGAGAGAVCYNEKD
ncbi:hypothetical protein, partial [Heyndrickxia faecalis]|uniref:hypothetical protein n=1 Tax=Heyndrickxia faecalis TaxID=2824910 RepID=UPI003D24A2D0